LRAALKSLAALALLALPGLPGAAARAAEEAPPVKLSGWKLERFRYGRGDKIPKKVEAEIKVANTGKKTLSQVKSRLIYYASTGEKVKETGWQFATVIAAGRTHTFRYVEGLVPAFEAYELRLHYMIDREKYKLVYRSPDPFSLPVPWSDKPVKGVSRLVLLGREVSLDPRTRQPRLYVRVKNLGEKPATGAAVILEFLGKGSKVIHKVEKRLGTGTIAGGRERSFNFLIAARVRGYSGYRVRLTAAKATDEEALSGGSFSDRPELEIAEFKFSRKPDKSLYIVAKIRNGRPEPVTGPTVVIQLTDKSTPPKVVKKVPFEVTGRLKPGEIRPFAVTVPDCPSFGAFSYEIEFAERTEVVFKPVTAEVERGKVGPTRIEVKKGPRGELVFVARVLSRAPHDVTALKITFNLYAGARGKVVGRCAGGVDKLAPGKSVRVVAELVKPPKFSNFNYKVTYKEPTPPEKGLPDRKELPERKTLPDRKTLEEEAVVKDGGFIYKPEKKSD